MVGTMAEKLVFLARMADGCSAERFRAEQEAHVAFVEKLGVVESYSYSFVEGTTDGTPPPYELIVELRVSSKEAFFAAMGSEAGKAALAHAATYTQDLVGLYLDEHVKW